MGWRTTEWTNLGFMVNGVDNSYCIGVGDTITGNTRAFCKGNGALRIDAQNGTRTCTKSARVIGVDYTFAL